MMYDSPLSLVSPCKRATPVQKSFTWKEIDKNSIKTLLVEQILETDIKFFLMVGTQSTWTKEDLEEERSFAELVWMIGRLVSFQL